MYDRYARHLALIKQYKKSGKLLDVGCGSGDYLKYLEKYTKYRLFGVEPNNLLRRYAIRNADKSTIKNGSISSIPYRSNFFDIITLYDVLEHSKDINSNLQELYRVLVPNGILLIQSPNYKSLMAFLTREKWDWWCIPDHILHFSPNVLTQVINDNGLKVKETFTYEDREDFISNLKGAFSSNLLTKILIRALIPLLIIIEPIVWKINRGGLIMVIAQKV